MQLYMESIQDLLDPVNDNISIVEDHKTGDVSVPGATAVDIRDQKSFLELLRLGEAHRFAANTKLNTESSRSHAILMVRRFYLLWVMQFFYSFLCCAQWLDHCSWAFSQYANGQGDINKVQCHRNFCFLSQVHVERSVKGRDSAISSENGSTSHTAKAFKPPVVRKSKLVVVDLAGSERIDKSGVLSKFLGKCIFCNFYYVFTTGAFYLCLQKTLFLFKDYDS